MRLLHLDNVSYTVMQIPSKTTLLSTYYIREGKMETLTCQDFIHSFDFSNGFILAGIMVDKNFQNKLTKTGIQMCGVMMR